MSKKVDVIIVNWNSGVQLAEAVKSISLYDNNLVSSVIVVDNASNDCSLSEVKFLNGLGFDLKVIINFENKGFAAACNQGASLAACDYLLFFNPDARLNSSSIGKVIEYMEDPENHDIGICGIQLIDRTGHVARSCARFPTSFGLVAHSSGLDRFFYRLGHFMSEWSHDTSRQVDHVIGAFYFVRRSVFVALGGFDQRFFVYFEDLDFSLRARKMGWRSMYLSDVQAYHAGGGTSDKIRARRLFYSLRSRLLYAFKHFSIFGSAAVMIATLLLEPFSRTAFAITKRSWGALRETWYGYFLLWSWFLQWIAKRRAY